MTAAAQQNARERQELSLETLAAWNATFEADAAARRSMNAVTRTPVDDVALDRARLLSVDTSMSHRLDDWKGRPEALRSVLALCRPEPATFGRPPRPQRQGV